MSRYISIMLLMFFSCGSSFAETIQLSCEGVVSGTNIRTENKNVDLIVDLATGVIEVSRPEVAPGCLTAWGEVSVTPRVSATDIRHTCIGKRVTSILSLSRMTGKLTIESFWYQEGGKNADDSWMGKYACTRVVRRF